MQAVRYEDVEDGSEWKAIRVDRQTTMLWNLSADISESFDVSAAHADVADRAFLKPAPEEFWCLFSMRIV